MVLGLLRPLAKNLLGAAVVGVAVALPVVTGIVIALYGLPHAWNDDTRLTVVIASLMFGVGGTIVWWRPPVDENHN